MSEILTSELLAKYGNAQVPRYTSYPTAPHFSPSVGAADYLSWLHRLPAEACASLYLHIPFCRAMCWYCGCHTTVAAREAPVERYLEALHREMELVAQGIGRRLPARHLHFGGGTPTIMAPDQMRATMLKLRETFALTEDAEIAIEIDPRTLSDDMARTLGDSGFNRASLGVQSFDHQVQRAINRIQSFDVTRDAVRALRRNGIASINFDLIYGLPHQTVQSCLDTVDRALALGPDRLAVFGYAHVPAFKLHQRKIDASTLPDSESRFAQSRAIADSLTRAGYVEIGLDHFALANDPLAVTAAAGRLKRNFQGYTTDDAEVLLGLGASSIGRLPQGFVQNEVRIGEYQRLVGEGRLPIARGYRLTEEDRLRGAVIERLMCENRVDLGAICAEFGRDWHALIADVPLGSFVADGLIEAEETRFVVKPHARPLVRSIAAAFDAYLDQAGRYSRAV